MTSIKSHLKFIGIVVGQILILLLFILSRFLWLSSSPEVVLKIHPIDPRDPFRGDYVTFSYDISNVSKSPILDWETGDKVYVVLKKTSLTKKYGDVWTYDYVTKTKPDVGVIFIKGFIQHEFPGSLPFNLNSNIKFGIEDYFIPEGRGREITLDENNSYAVVVINSDGAGILKNLYVNDEEL